MSTPVVAATTTQQEPEAAVVELQVALGDTDFALVLFFCSPTFVTSAFAAAIHAAFEGVPLIGCTTSGEIGPFGYSSGSVTAVGFARSDFAAVAGGLADVRSMEMSEANRMAVDLAERIGTAGGDVARNGFAFMLIDGLSLREETVASSIANALEGVPIFGGSAGDDLCFERSSVFYDGAFHSNACALVLMTTRHPFRVFRSQNFVSTERKFVVTDADPTARLVRELNAAPAVTEYAQMFDLDPEALTPVIFARFPLVVKLGGSEYVRSIQRANPDGSLTFYAAIDEGLVLTGADGRDIVANLEGLFDELRHQLGPPLVILGFDSILRRLHLAHSDNIAMANVLLRQNRVVGFNTYGEQFSSMHVNQTFTGVAIGQA